MSTGEAKLAVGLGAALIGAALFQQVARADARRLGLSDAAFAVLVAISAAMVKSAWA